MINVPDIAVVDMTEVTVLGTTEVVGVTVVVSLVDTIEVVVVIVSSAAEIESIYEGVTIMLVNTVEAIDVSDITAYYWENLYIYIILASVPALSCRVQAV